MSLSGQNLFELLPALYRLKDAQLAQSQNLLSGSEAAQLRWLQAEPGPLSIDDQAQLDALTSKASRGPLQSLLLLIGEQMAAVANDLDQLYDDQFIETCAPWVIPYIGDLIGYQSIHGKAATVSTPRAEVANTISFRRRKGTVLVLEQLARDVTGWGAHAVEFFKLLAATQYMNHPRPGNLYAPDLRGWEARAYMDTGFDATAHKVDVRRIAVGRGRYNIQNVGIFLWSLNAYSVTKSPAQPAQSPAGANAPHCFRFDALGRDIPLFNLPVSQGQDITAAAQPANVPNRLTRQVLCQDIRAGAGAVYYGEGSSLALYVNGGLLSPYEIRVCNLSGPEGSWFNLPAAGSAWAAAIDPELGRIALPPPAAGAAPAVTATYYYGFNADMGGGEYPRSDSFTQVPGLAVTRISAAHAGIQAALDSVSATGGVVEITDSGIYPVANLAVHVQQAGTTVELRAAEGCRPTILLGGEWTVTGTSGTIFNLNGLVIAAAVASGVPAPPALISVPAGNGNALSQLNVAHCTLVPGQALAPAGGPQPQSAALPSLAGAAPGLAIEISKSILGGLRTEAGVTASVTDSILDATNPANVACAASDGIGSAGALTLSGCTVIGKVHATLLTLASNCIFWAECTAGDAWPFALWVDRKGQGCVRFSYLPAAASTPRCFECQGSGSPGPLFQSLRYGDPGYCKLFATTDDTVRRGADDGGEMGAFHFVLAPLRETDLGVRLREYMPVGLEFGFFYET
jgi:hypothetical protein